jgi:hypothetical protein
LSEASPAVSLRLRFYLSLLRRLKTGLTALRMAQKGAGSRRKVNVQKHKVDKLYTAFAA